MKLTHTGSDYPASSLVNASFYNGGTLLQIPVSLKVTKNTLEIKAGTMAALAFVTKRRTTIPAALPPKDFGTVWKYQSKVTTFGGHSGLPEIPLLPLMLIVSRKTILAKRSQNPYLIHIIVICTRTYADLTMSVPIAHAARSGATAAGLM